MNSPFELTPVDRASPVWRRLMDHMETRLAQHRAQNDGDKDAAATARLRGQISELKYLMSLNNERKVHDD